MSSPAALPDVAPFIASIRARTPSIQIQTNDLEPYSVDGVTPQVLISAASAEDAQGTLSAAHDAQLAVIPCGGGNYVGSANVPSRYDVALALTPMNRLVAHEPADLTVTVEPGMRLNELQRQLARHGQFLPLDPACDDSATVGGILAANASGPLRHAFGAARDWLIGLRVVHADGSASKSGGRVVKNVAGYDMHKLHVGAHGTLGVIVEATFKVAPLPAARRTLAVACDSPGRACDLSFAAWDGGLAVQAMEVLSPSAASAITAGATWALIIEAAGGAAAVDRTERDVRSLALRHGAIACATIDDVAWSRWSEAFRPRGLALRAAVLPSQVADAIESIGGATNPPARLSATVAAGVVRAQFDEIDDDGAVALVDRVRRALPAGANAVVEAAPSAVKRQIDVFGPVRDDFEIMRRLKEQFDPNGVLSPGRFMGRL